MNESKQLIVSIKANHVSNYYYERFGDDSNWRRIRKWDFDCYLKENEKYALEIKHDDRNLVVFMRFVLDNERYWSKWGLKPISKKYFDDTGRLTRIDMSFEKIKNKKSSGCLFMFVILLFILATIFALS